MPKHDVPFNYTEMYHTEEIWSDIRLMTATVRAEEDLNTALVGLSWTNLETDENVLMTFSQEEAQELIDILTATLDLVIADGMTPVVDKDGMN